MTRRFGLNHDVISAWKALRQMRYALSRTRKQRVFGIGLSRTGTKSMHQALRHLGYRSEHFPTHLLGVAGGNLTLDLDAVRHYEAITDTVASAFFRELDARYPDARFILTVRDIDAWLRSCAAHFASMDDEPAKGGAHKIRLLRQRIYGTVDFNPAMFRSAYLQHVEQVQAHFRGRDNLLVVDICNGEGWAPLCRFLGIETSSGAFPWANRRLS